MWISFAITLLGLWLVALPLTFALASRALFISDIFSGVILVIVGIISRKRKSSLPYWSMLAVGLWLQLAPLLFWAPSALSYLNDTFVGVWVIVLALVVRPLPKKTFQKNHSVPPGWSYNPSSWPQRIPVAFFAFVCWMISRYLAAFQLGYIDTIWDPVFGSGTYNVLNSKVSKAFIVSDAGLGAFAYTLEFLATVQGDTARWRTSPWIVAIFGILVIPVSLTSIILIILQPLVVGSWCFLCLITAACMLFPTGFAIDEVLAAIQYLQKVSPKDRLRIFFAGGKCLGAKDDYRSPPLTSSLLSLIRASHWGVTFAWNLTACVVIGIYLMISPYLFSMKAYMANLDPILGALTIVVAVVAYGEMARKCRYLIGFFALLLCISSVINLSGSTLVSHLISALLLGILCLRQGPIREKFKS